MVEQRTSKIELLSIILALAVIVIITASFFSEKRKSQPDISQQNFLASIYNNAESYEDVFSYLSVAPKPLNIHAGIVSHHFLAKRQIAEFYGKISSAEVTTIFLVSPDHFNNYFSSNTLAYTSFYDWNSPFGVLGADTNIINLITKDQNIETKDYALGLDHGIYIQIPFIKKFFPNAKIVPLLLKNSNSYDDFHLLGSNIRKFSNENSLLLVSSDFSHNSTIAQSKLSDSKSIKALKNINLSNIDEITNDCKQCIAILSGFMNPESGNFVLLDNINSFDISQQDKDSVTSYVFGYYSK